MPRLQGPRFIMSMLSTSWMYRDLLTDVEVSTNGAMLVVSLGSVATTTTQAAIQITELQRRTLRSVVMVISVSFRREILRLILTPIVFLSSFLRGRRAPLSLLADPAIQALRG
jgi:hypothetical protein